MSSLKEKYNQKFIEDNNLILAEVVIGSHAFNLNNEKSDHDLYGLFYLAKEDFFSLAYRIEADFKDVVMKEKPEADDITYSEIGKFFEALNKNDPNALELLASMGGVIKIKAVGSQGNEFFHNINLDWKRILSKKCEKSFGDYAISQVKKARGLNKNIVNPMDEERKSPLDFCRLMDNGQTFELRKWLEKRGLDQMFCGVVRLTNARDSYALYYDWVSYDLFSGIMSEEEVEETKKDRKEMGLPMGYGFKGIEMENSNEIRLSSIPKDWDKYVTLHTNKTSAPSTHPSTHPNIEFLGNISYNKDGYIKHCKDYERYWNWVKDRNEERYNNNLKQNYDTKNISHCIRLLSVAKEIGEGKGLILKRTADDRQFLMDVKYGKVEYDVAMNYAENIMKELPDLYKNSNLPEIPDFQYLNDTLIWIRRLLYT